MTKSYKVVWTEVAARDLEMIVDYIIEHDGIINAEKVHTKLHKAIARLAVVPKGWRIVPELRAEGVDIYREIHVAKRWRVVFRSHGATVVLLAVSDGRRDLAELLIDRAIEDSE